MTKVALRARETQLPQDRRRGPRSDEEVGSQYLCLQGDRWNGIVGRYLLKLPTWYLKQDPGLIFLVIHIWLHRDPLSGWSR